MRIESWTRLSWWQRTRFAMICTVIAGVFIAMVLAILIAAFQTSPSVGVVNWLTFTGFPLLVVVIIATLARLQQQINIRSPQDRDLLAAKRRHEST